MEHNYAIKVPNNNIRHTLVFCVYSSERKEYRIKIRLGRLRGVNRTRKRLESEAEWFGGSDWGLESC